MVRPAQQKYELFGVRACYVEYNVASTLTLHRVWFTKKCDFKVTSQAIAIEGDGQKVTRYFGYEAEGSIEASIDDTTLDDLLWGTAADFTPGGSDHYSIRFFKGAAAEHNTVYLGVRLVLDGEDATTGAPIVVVYRMLKVAFAPDQPDVNANQTLVSRILTWSAHRTSTDVAGGAVTGMPSGGCYWIKDIITNPTYFDQNGVESL